MLVLSRKDGEAIYLKGLIDPDTGFEVEIVITVLHGTRTNKARLGISAPPFVRITRNEHEQGGSDVAQGQAERREDQGRQ